MCLLFAGNDTVLILKWRGGYMRCAEFRLVQHAVSGHM